MRLISSLLAFGSTFSLLAISAEAGTINTTFRAVDSETDIHLIDGSSAEYVAVGAYRWDGDPSATGILHNTFHTFCIDFVQNINYNTAYTFDTTDLAHAPVTTTPVMGDDRAKAIRELYGLNYASLDTSTKIAGFQMAIWEILFESPYTSLSLSSLDLASGNFRVDTSFGTPDAVGVAQGFLSSIFANNLTLKTGDMNKYNLVALTNPTYQDQIVVTPVPTPNEFAGGMALCGLLLGGKLWQQKRRVSSLA